MAGSSGPKDDEVDVPDGSFDDVSDEARHVIEEQLQTLRDTDKKAMATARINGLILGVLASAASLAENPNGDINNWIIGGGAILLLSLCASVVTYTVDRPNYAVGPGYFDTILDELDSEQAVKGDLLARYADWIEGNSAEISTNGTYLLVSQVLFVLGLLVLGVGVYTFI